MNDEVKAKKKFVGEEDEAHCKLWVYREETSLLTVMDNLPRKVLKHLSRK